MIHKMSKNIIIFFSITFFLFGCLKKTSGLKQADIKPLTFDFLERHVKYSEFTDEISEKTLFNLIDFLDPGKYYFYKSDIENLNKYKQMIDDYVKKEEYAIIFDILELYKKRVKENIELFNELIKQEQDFSKDESIILNRDKVEFAVNKEDMKERWRKNIKLQLLNQISMENDIKKAKKKIAKNYELFEKRIEEINEDKMIAIFLNAFSTALDPHSNYLSQDEHEDFQISTNLKLEGIGVLLRAEEGFIKVERIIPGGAAAKLPVELQLRPEDKIAAVAQADGLPVDVLDMALRDVVKLIRGEKGTVVRLTIIRETDEKQKQIRLTIPITREEIKLEDKEAKSDAYLIKKNNKEKKIGYIKLPSFYMDFDGVNTNNTEAKRSSRDVITQINILKNKNIDGLVIDLRGNPGGALTEARDIAGMFIDEGPILQILVRNKIVEVMEDVYPGVYYDGPVVILIDEFSASASEIFAGAIKDYRRGLILGPSNTFGKGTVQTYNVLNGKNGAMKITTAIFYQPGGTSNQGNGIAPDIQIPDISSAWDMGEEKLNHPLQWEKIKTAKFQIYNKYLKSNTIENLRKISESRVKNSEKFQDIIKKIKSIKEKRKEKSISLKEEAKIENQQEKDLEKKAMKHIDDTKIIDMENDLFLNEAFNITYDYINMLNIN